MLSISPFAFTTESLRRPGGVSVLASSRQFDIGGPVCVNMCDDVVSVCVHVCVCVCVCVHVFACMCVRKRVTLVVTVRLKCMRTSGLHLEL